MSTYTAEDLRELPAVVAKREHERIIAILTSNLEAEIMVTAKKPKGPHFCTWRDCNYPKVNGEEVIARLRLKFVGDGYTMTYDPESGYYTISWKKME